jgi:cell division cycle protein 20 (cofactor of APC complex)
MQAVAWCPWQPNVLATGGGANDKTIRLWNTYTGQCTETVETKSQVLPLFSVPPCIVIWGGGASSHTLPPSSQIK